MLMKSKVAKHLLVGLMGAGLVATVGACTAPESNTVSESPATSESPMTDMAQSPMTDTAESPMTGDAQNSAASGETVDKVVAQNTSFSKLNAAIQAAGLQETLSQDGPYTVFAPTDEAFAALPAETLDKLLLPENKDKLQQVLAYHVVPGNITSNSITPGDVQTVEGAPVSVSADAGTVKVGDAQVIEPDITASNGVIHAIDKVLLPPDFQI
ncbi:MAG TPA: fasciclin domain-containing protein [Allocoleopsis sp.]